MSATCGARSASEGGAAMTRRRPAYDFRVTSVQWEMETEAMRRALGCAPVPREVVMRRFFTFVSFLQSRGLTTGVVAESLGRVHEFSELTNADLTDEGYEFVSACHWRWVNRMGRDAGDARERVLLDGWLRQFRG